jgi:hypothetical protein
VLPNSEGIPHPIACLAVLLLNSKMRRELVPHTLLRQLHDVSWLREVLSVPLPTSTVHSSNNVDQETPVAPNEVLGKDGVQLAGLRVLRAA